MFLCVFERIKTAPSFIFFIKISKFETGRQLLMTYAKYEHKDVKKKKNKLKITLIVKPFSYAPQKATVSCYERCLEALSEHNVDHFC